MKSSYILFFMTLMVGTLMTVSASSWFTAWIGLEMNLLSFLPLLINSPNSTESAMKYFFMQAIGSMIMILFMVMPVNQTTNTMLSTAMLLKLGAAPLHFWLPPTMKSLSWLNSALLLSWQKMAPLTILTFTSPNSLLFLAMISSALVGAWGGMNELRMKQLFAYASINHMAWLMTLSLLSMSLTTFYLLIYMLLMFTIFMLTNKLFHLTQIWLNTRSTLNLVLPLLMLSSAGLPPLTGFAPKWLALNEIMAFSKPISFMLMLSSLFLLYYYLRITWMTLSLSKLTHMPTPPIKSYFWSPLIMATFALPTTTGWQSF